MSANVISGPRKKKLSTRIWENKWTYIMLFPGFLYYIIFAYGPMPGLQLAFKNFNARLGIWGSSWVGIRNYTFLFRDPVFWRAMQNTVIISLQRICIQFPMPIILALLINELNSRRYKRVLQTIFTFPHFLSWVIVAGIMFNLLTAQGIISNILVAFGFDSLNLLAMPSIIRPMLYATDIWKGAGWSAIIYMAAIAGIDQEQYESAIIDGATRMQRIFYITIPGIRETIIILFILAWGGIMNAGFDQIFNLGNVATQSRIDILDWYIYRITFQSSTDFGFSTAVALMRSILNFTFLLTANHISRMVAKTGLFV